MSKNETVIIALKHGSIDVICDEGHSLFFFSSVFSHQKRRSMVHVAQPMDKERDTEIEPQILDGNDSLHSETSTT